MSDFSWLRAIKPGDEVCVASGYGLLSYEMKKVDRVTNTLIIAGNYRFRISDGHESASTTYRIFRLVEVTQEIKDKVRQQKLTEWLSTISAKKQPLDVLEAMYAAYKSAVKKETVS